MEAEEGGHEGRVWSFSALSTVMAQKLHPRRSHPPRHACVLMGWSGAHGRAQCAAYKSHIRLWRAASPPRPPGPFLLLLLTYVQKSQPRYSTSPPPKPSHFLQDPHTLAQKSQPRYRASSVSGEMRHSSDRSQVTAKALHRA